MKKCGLPVLMILATFLTVKSSHAQESFKLGDNVVNASIGLGGFAGSYGSTSLPPISVGLDHGIADNFSVGGLVGIARSSWDYPGYSFSYTYIVLGARGTYHFGDLLKQALKGAPLDPYVGVTLGYNIVSASSSGTLAAGASASGSYLLFGADLGARYWFTPKLAGQLELGYGVGVISLGIAYKL